ncbi:hypothetical protein H9W90_10270 [Polaribacter pectinis]|uniref:Uncharacterized protein n=1 Tax=Polaribacter pectinis TaxID=2738844 RepID=A0A7G9L7I2_9FLAO|nr:hypothetical protein [Polaribacter pectinis]QNM84581.1 hypothetical protein H9W90_10270 [Polaribacter pectinis]
MKKESKLGVFKIKTAPFLCEFIFKFQLNDRDQKLLLIRKLYATINENNSFIKKAFHHIYNSACYFTNGEKIISYRKDDNFYELGIHHNINKFEHYFGENLHTRKIWDVDISFKKYAHKESLEKEIYSILSVKEGKRKVLVTNSEYDFIQTFTELNMGVFLKINPKKIIEYYTNDLKVVSEKFEQKCAPIKLKSCFNCGYFKQQGDFPIDTNNSLHECMLIKQKTNPEQFNESITHIWSYCSNFIEQEK